MIQINDLDFTYSRQKGLFNGLSLHLEPGSITGLLGKNGAGKTTLLKLMTGLLHSNSGVISILGHDPKNREVSMLNDVFLVPEEFYFPSISIQEYVKAFAPFYPRFDQALFVRILEEFELMAENNLQKHSHGQKKKFLIAFALSTRCRLLVLDEPTNGLDIPSKSLFRKILAGSLDEDQLDHLNPSGKRRGESDRQDPHPRRWKDDFPSDHRRDLPKSVLCFRRFDRYGRGHLRGGSTRRIPDDCAEGPRRDRGRYRIAF